MLRVPKAALMTSDCLISSDQKLSAAFGKFRLLSPAQVSLFLRFLVAVFGKICCLACKWYEQCTCPS